MSCSIFANELLTKRSLPSGRRCTVTVAISSSARAASPRPSSDSAARSARRTGFSAVFCPKTATALDLPTCARSPPIAASAPLSRPASDTPCSTSTAIGRR